MNTNQQPQPAVGLTKEDVKSFPLVIRLLAEIKEYMDAPVTPMIPPGVYPPGIKRKDGSTVSDFASAWSSTTKLYNDVFHPLTNLLIYYRTKVKPIEYTPDPDNYSVPPPEALVRKVNARYLESFIGYYAEIKEYIVEAINWFYDNDPLYDDLNPLLVKHIGEMTGREFIALQEEVRRQNDVRRQIEALR